MNIILKRVISLAIAIPAVCAVLWINPAAWYASLAGAVVLYVLCIWNIWEEA